jgi:hypothetical protein
MTMYRCWISYDNDRVLQSRIKRGYFSDEGEPYIPISCFLAAPRSAGCWTGILCEWCRKSEIPFVKGDLEVSARVKKSQIEDFIEHVYGGDPYYFDPAKMLTSKGRAYMANSLTDLRAFVAQQLSSRFWYKLEADEW